MNRGGSSTQKSQHSLSLDQARRIVLQAQGFNGKTPERLTARQIQSVIHRIGMLQIDSVNVLVRAHYFPVFSRLGPYPLPLLDDAVYSVKRRIFFEYWGHEASILPVETFPFLRWRMERARNYKGTWKSVAGLAKDRPEFVESVLEVLRIHGPAGARELERHLVSERRAGKGGWWGWSEVKTALEWLFWSGAITTARRRNFERVYDLTERVVSPAILKASIPSVEEAQRELVRIAARALGLATGSDLRDYFRLRTDEAKARIGELVDNGELIPVKVESWEAYLHRDARMPRFTEAKALLSPFDPLIWERKRVERLFQFHYRIGIYTPAHRREHGYYVLPFLFQNRLVGRVDLRADRKERRLEVLASHGEQHAGGPEVIEALSDQIMRLAVWLSLEQISVADRGDLAQPLRYAIQSRGIRRTV